MKADFLDEMKSSFEDWVAYVVIKKSYINGGGIRHGLCSVNAKTFIGLKCFFLYFPNLG